jgi:Flp pilus assembly protein TadD/mono/diheme cytochrome c family protein
MRFHRAIAAVPALLALIVLSCDWGWTPRLKVRAATGAVTRAVTTQEPVAARQKDAAGDRTLTWSHDIAGILYKNCATCHHPGGAGPFSLLTYADARRWGPQLVAVTQSRFMPPWLPEPGYGNFADVRRLGDRDRALIKQWVAEMMPEGDAAAAPAAPHFEGSWVLGKPDIVLKFPRSFTVSAGGTDVFWNFILPYPLTQTHSIRGMEIRPGSPQVVHHANIAIDRLASMRRKLGDRWQDGVGGMDLYIDAGNSFDPDSHFLFWKPDTPALIEPEDMPWRLDPGNDLILNMHLKPSGKPETMDGEVGLYFASKPATKQPILVSLDRDDALDIPAGDAHFVVEDSLMLPVDVEALGVYPHAHYLGHDLEGWAILPSGEKKWLVWIRNWDIDRQSIYRYEEPVFLPRGTVLYMRYTYDNSEANPHNPHVPPVRVRAGNRSEDEMAHLWVQLLPVHVAGNGPDPRLQIEEAWMRDRLRKTPNDAICLYNLAAALAGEKKYVEASVDFEELLKQSPRDERTLTALGAAQDGEGDWQAAIDTFRHALAWDAPACDARFDLAEVELRHDQAAAAEADFRTALSECHENAETHAGLGAALQAQSQPSAAEAEFRKSLELAPDNLTSLFGLAQIKMDAGENDAAIELLHEATDADPGSADAHMQLARAYGQKGDLQNALAELRAAERLRPEDAAIHSALSQVLAGQGNLQDATEEQRAALKLAENDPDGWNNLGALEARSGRLAAARVDFEHALQLDPANAEAKANLARLAAQTAKPN